jgi:hypothetical protein
MLSIFDVGLLHHPGVVRIMTYGDSFVACAGLLSPREDHAAVVADFARWQSSTAKLARQRLPVNPFHLRVSVCSGPLGGGVVGGAELRYVIAGPPFDLALENLHRVEPGCVVVDCVLAEPQIGSDAAGEKRPAAADGSSALPEDDSSAIVAAGGARSVASEPAATAEFSLVWLSFTDDGVADKKRAADRLNDTASRAVAAFFCFLTGAYFLAALVEFAHDDPARRPTWLPVALLGLAAGLSAAYLRLRFAAGSTPPAVSIAFLVAAYALLEVGVVLLGSLVVRTNLGISVAVALVPMFLPLPWLAQAALQVVLVVVPIVVLHAVTVSRVVLSFLLAIVVVARRYASVKGVCLGIAAKHLAGEAMRAAQASSDHHDKLLYGLLPEHTLPFVDVVNDVVVVESGDYAGAQWWNDLSILQLRFRASGAGVTELQDVWARLTAVLDAAVGASGGRVSAVETRADSIVVAGPFLKDATDEVLGAAAQQVYALVRSIATALRGAAAFTAVLTAGSGFDALVGASCLSYRLVGPAMRESHALLEAAPETLRHDGMVVCAAESFRRMHYNTRHRVARPSGGLQPAMSVAVLNESGTNHAFGESTSAAIGGSEDVASFGQSALWRVAGIGVVTVATVVL